MRYTKKCTHGLHNCLKFYLIYAHLPHKRGGRSLLDEYICSRFAEMRDAMTKGLDAYHIDEAVAPIGAFVEDLSTWYIRRSRDRIKNRTDDGAEARETLRFILTEFAKCLAPVRAILRRAPILRNAKAPSAKNVFTGQCPPREVAAKNVVSERRNRENRRGAGYRIGGTRTAGGSGNQGAAAIAESHGTAGS